MVRFKAKNYCMLCICERKIWYMLTTLHALCRSPKTFMIG